MSSPQERRPPSYVPTLTEVVPLPAVEVQVGAADAGVDPRTLPPLVQDLAPWVEQLAGQLAPLLEQGLVNGLQQWVREQAPLLAHQWAAQAAEKTAAQMADQLVAQMGELMAQHLADALARAPGGLAPTFPMAGADV